MMENSLKPDCFYKEFQTLVKEFVLKGVRIGMFSASDVQFIASTLRTLPVIEITEWHRKEYHGG